MWELIEKKVNRNQCKARMLELANKNFKVTIVNTFKNLKENIAMTNTKKGKHKQIQSPWLTIFHLYDGAFSRNHTLILNFDLSLG